MGRIRCASRRRSSSSASIWSGCCSSSSLISLAAARVTGSWRSRCSLGSRRDGAAMGLAAVVWGAAALVGAWPGLARCYRALGARRRGRHGRICSSACPGYVRHLLLSLICLFYFFPSSSPSSLVTGLPCLVEVRPCRDAAAVLLVLLCCYAAAMLLVLLC